MNKMRSPGVVIAALAFCVSPAVFGQGQPSTRPSATADEVHLFAFFRGQSTDGLHMARSDDGLNWQPIAADRTFIKPEVGEGKLMRDPSLLQGPDGTFHFVWTTGWTGKTIGYSSSKDLIHWSPQMAIPVMADKPDARECWAPEIRWDKSKGEFLIYWSSSVRSETPAYQHTWATTTKDFKSFTPTRSFFDPGYACIDASILEDKDGKFRLFFKHNSMGIRFAVSDTLQGPYTQISELFAYPGQDEWEGPWPTHFGDDWIVYIDHFKGNRQPNERMGVWRSPDLKTWENISAKASGLRGSLHGSVLKVPRALVESIEKAVPATNPSGAAN